LLKSHFVLSGTINKIAGGREGVQSRALPPGEETAIIDASKAEESAHLSPERRTQRGTAAEGKGSTIRGRGRRLIERWLEVNKANPPRVATEGNGRRTRAKRRPKLRKKGADRLTAPQAQKEGSEK